MSSLASPERVWWKPLDGRERFWLVLGAIWCLVLFGGIIVWHYTARQNIPTETYRTTPAEFQALSTEFTQKYRVGDEGGIPVVRPPDGADVYLVARTWQWGPILELKKGATYRIHLSSMDLQHGFSLQPGNLNFMVLPDYDYVVTLTPDKAGDYQIVCNEFCGIGHQAMVGKIKVTE